MTKPGQPLNTKHLDDITSILLLTETAKLPVSKTKRTDYRWVSLNSQFSQLVFKKT